MIIKAEMDSVLFDANEELKKRDMRIKYLEEQNKELKQYLIKSGWYADGYDGVTGWRDEG